MPTSFCLYDNRDSIVIFVRLLASTDGIDMDVRPLACRRSFALANLHLTIGDDAPPPKILVEMRLNVVGQPLFVFGVIENFTILFPLVP